MYSECRLMYVTFGADNLLSLIFVALRVYINYCITKRAIDLGDCKCRIWQNVSFADQVVIIFITLFLYLAPQGVMLFGCTNGVIGVHAWGISTFEYELFAKVYFPTNTSTKAD
jgi:hypothetical protein